MSDRISFMVVWEDRGCSSPQSPPLYTPLTIWFLYNHARGLHFSALDLVNNVVAYSFTVSAQFLPILRYSTTIIILVFYSLDWMYCTQTVPLTLTIWRKPTPLSNIPTSPGTISIESVARDTGVGGHSVQTQC